MEKISRLKKNNQLNKISRLKKVSEWSQIQMSDPDLIQKITDSITYGYPVQINYESSGWRNIQPYGWNTSKDQNILLMCYKDTGEVRSYRLDKIQDLYIDYDNQVATNNNPQMNSDEETQIYDDIMSDQQNSEIDMPILPEENNQIQEQPGIYDNELSMLSDDINNENVFDYNINNNEEENINNDQQNIQINEENNINNEEENNINNEENNIQNEEEENKNE